MEMLEAMVSDLKKDFGQFWVFWLAAIAAVALVVLWQCGVMLVQLDLSGF